MADLTDEGADRAHEALVEVPGVHGTPAQLPLTNEGGNSKFVQGCVLEARPLDAVRLGDKVVRREASAFVAVDRDAELFEQLAIGIRRWHLCERQKLSRDQIVIFHDAESA